VKRRDFIKASGSIVVALVSDQLPGAGQDLTNALTVRQVSTDQFELAFSPRDPRPVRILQITDTHLGSLKPGDREKDRRTYQTIRSMVEIHRPDLIVHTGDFIWNDRKETSWEGLDFMNSLPVPWCHALGNHDVDPENGSLHIEYYRKKMKNAAFGYFDRNGKREYAYRLDLVAKGSSKPGFAIYCFDSGYKEGLKHISDGQLAWFGEQMDRDARVGIRCPILVMMHIPILEYKLLRASGKFTGRCDEEVCRETDAGQTFKAFKASGRVRATFCGHDHVNDFAGIWDGIELVYGRWTGWAAYGDGNRGGRLIEIDLTNGTYAHKVVYSSEDGS